MALQVPQQRSKSGQSQDSLPGHFQLMRIFSEENAKSAQELILDLKSDLDPESVRFEDDQNSGFHGPC